MTEPDDEDSRPLHDLRRLVGGACRDCRTAYTAREAVGSIILGFKDAPRCVPCLALALRGRMNALPPGAVLRVTATDPAAPEDLPAWCRLTGHRLLRMHHPDYYI